MRILSQQLNCAFNIVYTIVCFKQTFVIYIHSKISILLNEETLFVLILNTLFGDFIPLFFVKIYFKLKYYSTKETTNIPKEIIYYAL